MKILTILGLALLLSACEKAPPISQSTTNEGVEVFLVAVVDGCNLWGINRGSGSSNIYMARCPEGAANVETTKTQMIGKVLTTVKSQTVGAQ